MHRIRIYDLKFYCELVDINFKELLSHSRATWLPCHETITADFSCHELIFFSPNLICQKFFSSLKMSWQKWHFHAIMAMFHTNTQQTESERNAVLEVLTVLQSFCQLLQHRRVLFPENTRDPK
jgi:hypothetical protein